MSDMSNFVFKTPSLLNAQQSHNVFTFYHISLQMASFSCMCYIWSWICSTEKSHTSHL